MIKHIVMWKLKSELSHDDKRDNSLKIKKQIEDLKDKIDVILDLEVGINFEESNQSYDLVLYSSFKSKYDLNCYQNHSNHQEVAEFIKTVVEARVVVDYEI